MTQSESRSSQTQYAPARKDVLFCPHCGHESLVDGDWLVRSTGRRETVRCPDCRRVVERRPNFDRAKLPAVYAEHPASRLSDAADRWRPVWSSMARAWVRFVTPTRG